MSLHYLVKHESQKLCLFSPVGRQPGRRSGAMSRFFALLGAQSRSFCKLTGDATVNTFSSEKKTKSTACSESSAIIETRYRAWLKRRDFGVHVSPGSAETLLRRGGIKWLIDSILSRQHLCQKLAKSVNVRWSYSCNISVVFWDTVYMMCIVFADGLQVSAFSYPFTTYTSTIIVRAV